MLVVRNFIYLSTISKMKIAANPKKIVKKYMLGALLGLLPSA
jgi:hypothetical protein